MFLYYHECKRILSEANENTFIFHVETYVNSSIFKITTQLLENKKERAQKLLKCLHFPEKQKHLTNSTNWNQCMHLP